jgi:hypothetical protein
MFRGPRTPAGKVRWMCREGGGDRAYCYSTTSPGPVARSAKRPAVQVFKRKLGRSTSRFVITSAQNATPVHDGFMAALRAYCNEHDAELLVIPIRYKNVTSQWHASQANEEVWAAETVPFLTSERVKLGANLIVLGDVKTQPTASSPLAGFDAITHGESGILGHTKLQLRTVPTPQSRTPKLLTTTGACTLPNYTDSKAGKLGEFHHSLAATVVEVQGKQFHLRQLNAKRDGSFIDLDREYLPDGRVKLADRAAALAMGDTHVDFIDPHVYVATFGAGGMIDVLAPRELVWNDLLDGYAVNPHHYGNPFNLLAKRQAGRDNIQAEVERALQFVADWTTPDRASTIVASNHDDFLRRWLVNTDWRLDPTNAIFYLETALEVARATAMGDGGTESPSPFALLARKALAGYNVKVLGGNESHTVEGIELGMHGDRGPNGARGTIKNLRRIGVKSIIGHSHSPGIDEGCYQTGTSTRLRLEYNSGPSSWLNTHVVVYANGKRALLNIINGEWRTQ